MTHATCVVCRLPSTGEPLRNPMIGGGLGVNVRGDCLERYTKPGPVLVCAQRRTELNQTY